MKGHPIMTVSGHFQDQEPLMPIICCFCAQSHQCHQGYLEERISCHTAEAGAVFGRYLLEKMVKGAPVVTSRQTKMAPTTQKFGCWRCTGFC